MAETDVKVEKKEHFSATAEKVVGANAPSSGGVMGKNGVFYSALRLAKLQQARLKSQATFYLLIIDEKWV